MFITSLGRNVSPEWVERELVLQPPIRQAAVFGEGRPSPVAVVVMAEGADRAAVDRALAQANLDLPDYARVHDWVQASEPFTLANGQLTATGRLRRPAILARYQQVLNEVCGGVPQTMNDIQGG